MAHKIEHSSFQEFLEYNSDVIYDNYFIHYHFINALEKLSKGEIDVYEAYNIVDNNGESIICMWTSGTIFIYSMNWNDEMIPALSEAISPEKFNNYTFVGQRQLIEQMLEYSNVQPTWRKNRIIYSCNEVIPFASQIAGIVENARLEYANQISALGINYYHFEFENRGSKSDEEVTETILSGILKRNLYTLRVDQIIHSTVTVIDGSTDNPMIGALFTKVESRNNGYAYKLLYEVTCGLLNEGYQSIGLLSNADNPNSNLVFVKIGYQPIYELVLAEISRDG